MTETTDTVKLPEAVERFVLHWGDLGGTWGVNRTVAQIHALLYMSERPLNAEDIQIQLGVARSNVSNSLKELLGFKLVRRHPIPGDRRDHFVAETDVWQVARHIAAARKAREIDPALATLEDCLAAAAGDANVSNEQIKRLREMHEFTATMDRWYDKMSSLPSSTLSRLVAMGDAVVKVLNLGRKS
jgi:DNA-binding transcriptional regulator GbsR (MarR family)